MVEMALNPELSIVFLYPKKTAVHGLQQDAVLIENALGMKGRHADPLEPPCPCDVAFHFEIPIYGWMPWASKNVCVVNPEWWNSEWDSYLKHMDLLIFKCQEDATRFVENRQSKTPHIVLPWTSPVPSSVYNEFQSGEDHSIGCLMLVGASMHKQMAAEKILAKWKSSWPPLHVCAKEPLLSSYESNVHVDIKDLSTAERQALQAFYPCHIVVSASEALSLVAHEGMAAGAFLIANELPTYKEALDRSASFLIPSTLVPKAEGLLDTFEHLESGLEEAVKAFQASNIRRTRATQQRVHSERLASFKNSLLEYTFIHIKNKETLPPMMTDEELPCISVITPLYNRRRFVELCIHNLLLTDYPKEKIEWVVVEDSDNTDEQSSDKIIKFGRNAAPISVSYIPLEEKKDIGEKRNLGVYRAQHDIILMMDDDDHYPRTSFRRRVSWLLRHSWAPKAAVCTTIACYDLVRGVSAVNSPPFTMGLKKRVSEATLVFKKSWWEEKKFPQVSMAEGEGFLDGREEDVLELPPQQCIVAFSHGKNLSSRKIPDGPPSCFWGFPKEYLTFIHGLAGISVEE
jgi:hypothetical protein